MIDSGINSGHEDFVDRIGQGWNRYRVCRLRLMQCCGQASSPQPAAAPAPRLCRATYDETLGGEMPDTESELYSDVSDTE